jgi:serine/threonine protein phosphatase 1
MLKRLFQRGGRAVGSGEPLVEGRPPALPRGARVYVVGDVHGRLDLLLAVERLISADVLESGRHLECLLVYLGDFVDRGFDSRKVMDHVVQARADELARVYLLGNHDLWLREFAGPDPGGEEMAASWVRFGGDATLLSYGITLDLRQPEPERFAEARRVLRARFPGEHAAFLAGLDSAFGLGDYFFCHAGIRPEVPLERQTDADLLWIREPFLSWNGDCGKIVVHGHTVEEAPVVRPNRIGIDTGACWTGRLTCLVLEGAERRFLQTGR